MNRQRDIYVIVNQGYCHVDGDGRVDVNHRYLVKQSPVTGSIWQHDAKPFFNKKDAERVAFEVVATDPVRLIGKVLVLRVVSADVIKKMREAYIARELKTPEESARKEW